MIDKIDREKLTSDIIKLSGIRPSRIFNITIFGSRVYGTDGKESDWDVIMVANNSVESTEIRRGIFNIHVYTPDKFRADLNWHRINNLECIFAPDWAILKETIDYRKDFKVNISKLRHATSHISSNSWVKSKKKLTVADEYYVGIKSLFHSIRIPMFATQVVNHGKIVDYSCANWIWDKLIFNDKPSYSENKLKWSWDKLDEEFREIHNSVLTEFRKVAAK
jgi:predicted nucleotidyltransferase